MTQADRTQLSEIEIQRHSFAHVLAMAALRVFKNTKIGIGAVVDNGFYQDFQFETPIGKSDLEKIEREMQSIIEEEVSFQQLFVSKEQAFDILNLQGQIFKTEILQNIAEEQVSFYRTGKEFIDLCRGPHVDHTGKLGAFKLISISGVYWNNDKTRPQLQRILGVSFPTEAELSNYFKEREAKKEKDHRKLGQKLDLFTFVADNGSGLPIWLPKGFSVIDTIRNFVRKEQSKAGYTYVSTPSIVKSSVFEDSSVPQSK
ncbi:threonine--tRNA ligase, partial [Candidatus Dojkabacteria bacterium]|nr:threonine--tRNA ligase [Candidatus Dojkabacteria bacterium]